MATVLSALIAATVAVTGWFIGHELATRRDDRRKRLELIIGHSERQISEFYSPLAFLIEQLHTNAQVKEGIDKDRRVDVGEFMHHNAFLSLHEEIVCVLKTKCHLLEGAVIPQVLLDYIAHFTSEKLAWRWTEITKEPDAQIFNYVRPYPASLLNQLKEDREFARRRYEEAVQELRHGAFATPVLKKPASLFPRFAQRLSSALRRSPKLADELMPGRVGNSP